VPSAYEKEFGADYEKPHGFARFLAFIYRLIPKIGPFRALSFSVPTPEAERLFLESFTSTREHFRQTPDALSVAHLHLVNTDFDTGQRTKRGEYSWLTTGTTSCSESSPIVHSPTSRRTCGRTWWNTTETSTRSPMAQTPSESGRRRSRDRWQSSIW
jgi:hypothetical protein